MFVFNVERTFKEFFSIFVRILYTVMFGCSGHHPWSRGVVGLTCKIVIIILIKHMYERYMLPWTTEFAIWLSLKNFNLARISKILHAHSSKNNTSSLSRNIILKTIKSIYVPNLAPDSCYINISILAISPSYPDRHIYTLITRNHLFFFCCFFRRSIAYLIHPMLIRHVP